MNTCKAIGCNQVAENQTDFCEDCLKEMFGNKEQPILKEQENMALKYPKYYKDTQGMTEIDVYAVHHLFNIQDPSGCTQHASKKLLLSGTRTGGKSAFMDIKEARDTLTRWLQLNPLTE